MRRVFLVPLCLFSLLVGFACEAVSSPAPALVGWWRFQNPSDLGQDSSGNNHELTVNGGATYSSAGVNGGGALSLDGTGFLSAATFPALIPTGDAPYAIAAWIKPADLQSRHGIVGWGSYGSQNEVNAFRTLAASDNQNGLVNYWWGTDLIEESVPMTTSWTHVVAQYDGTTRSIWVNGSQVASDTPGAHSTTATNFTVGLTSIDYDEYFHGLLDDVRVYNGALSASEISMLAGARAVPGLGGPMLALLFLATVALGMWRLRRGLRPARV
jgi:hypothetical protein